MRHVAMSNRAIRTASHALTSGIVIAGLGVAARGPRPGAGNEPSNDSDVSLSGDGDGDGDADGDGDLWASGLMDSPLLHVDADMLEIAE